MEYAVALSGLSIVVQTLFSMERPRKAVIFYLDGAEILRDVKLFKDVDLGDGTSYHTSYVRQLRSALVSKLRLPYTKLTNYTLVYIGDRYLQMLVLVFDDIVNKDKALLYEYDGVTQTGACYLADSAMWAEEQSVHSVHVFERILAFCKDYIYFVSYDAGDNRQKFREAMKKIGGLEA